MKSLDIHRLPFLASLALLATACLSSCSPFATSLTTQKPKSEDVVGVYALQSQSLTSSRKLDFLQGLSATVELSGNGTYIATNFPVWMRDSSGRYVFKNLVTATGRWEIDSAGSADGRPDWGVQLLPDPDSSALQVAPNLTHNKPPYGLIFQFGDPDSGNALIYDKLH
jgi:hypothetical protein